MKNKKLGIRIITAMCAALGWWGLLYPELTLTPETVRIVIEDASGQEISLDRNKSLDDSFYLELLEADSGSIRDCHHYGGTMHSQRSRKRHYHGHRSRS